MSQRRARLRKPRVCRFALIPIAFAVGSLVVGACTSNDETSDSTSSVPAGGSGSDALPGAAPYRQSCGSCHGNSFEGSSKGPSHLSVVYKSDHHSDDSFRSAIANGVPAHHWTFGDMPPVPGLTAEQVGQIIAYVRAVQAERGFEPYPPE